MCTSSITLKIEKMSLTSFWVKVAFAYIHKQDLRHLNEVVNFMLVIIEMPPTRFQIIHTGNVLTAFSTAEDMANLQSLSP